jgi:uncharacterized membrane protein
MAVTLALAAAALSGTGDFFGGLASRHDRVLSVVLVNHVSGLAVVLAIGSFFEGSLDGSTLLWGSLAGSSGAFAVAALYTGFARSSIAVVSPVAAVGGGVWPAVWEIAGGDVPTPLVGSGIVLGLAAIWVISSGGRISDAEDVRAGVLFGMLAGLGFGALLICLSLAPESSGIWALVPARAVGGIAIVVIALGLRQPLAPSRRGLAAGTAAGTLTLFGNAAFIIAATKGSLAVVSVLAAMFPAATVILARIVLGERLTPQRRVGLALALIAVGLVSGG